MPTLARALLSILVILTIAPAVDARGPKAAITFYTVERPVETFGPLTTTSVTVSCDGGDEVVGGGYAHTKDQPDLQVSGSAPTGDGGWLVQMQNFSATLSYQLVLYARCAKIGP